MGCDTSYTVNVTAVNAGGSGPAGSDAFTTSACPQAQVTDQSPTSLLIDWSDDPGAVSYKVYRNGQQISSVDAPTSEYLDEGLDPNTTYDYLIVAVLGSGAERNVATASGTTQAAVSMRVPVLPLWGLLLLGASLAMTAVKGMKKTGN